MSPMNMSSRQQLSLVLVLATAFSTLTTSKLVAGAEISEHYARDAFQTTLAPVNAMAAAAISDAVKHAPALAHLGANGTSTNGSAGASVGNASAVSSSSTETKSGDGTTSNSTTTSMAHQANPSVSPTTTSISHPTTVKPVAAAPTASGKFDQYFEPICEHLEKLHPKQMFKIQSQLKKFVEMTNGKMSLCFAQQYAIEPNLTPVTKAQLEQICASRKEPASSGKVQFKSFESCAEQNWEATLDKELARIAAARLNCSKNHQHSKNDSSVALMHHDDDDDEVSVIGDVVSSVLGDSKSAVDKSNIKTIEVGPNGAVPVGAAAAPTTKTTVAPANAAPAPAVTTVPPVAPETSALAASTAAPIVSPSHAPSVAPAVSTTVVPTSAKPSSSTTPKPTTPPASTTVKPVPDGASKPTVGSATLVGAAASTLGPTLLPAKGSGNEILNNPNTVVVFVDDSVKAGSKSGYGPATTDGHTTAAPTLGEKLLKNVAGSAKKESPSSTGKPASTSTTKPKADGSTKAPSSSTAAPTKASGSELQKKKDEADAKRAIEALKLQRAHGHGSAADERMHQLEHDRQMSIDPVGHTIKHKIYEMKKAGVKA